MRPSIVATSGRWLLLANSDDEQAGSEEAERVEENGVGRGEDLHEQASEAGATDLGGRAADLELRVPLDDLVAVDERREVRHVRDVEEDLEDPDEEADDEELPEGQRVGDVRDGDREEKRGAPEVPDDQDRSPG